MQIKTNTPEQYINQLPDARKQAISKLREIIRKNLPEAITEVISYGMIGYFMRPYMRNNRFNPTTSE